MQEDLAASLAGIVVRRRLEEGEFAYVLLASGQQISGKKAAYKELKANEAVFQALKEDFKDEGETDLAFDSRCLKILNNVPFEDDQDTGAVLAAAEAAMSSSPSKSKDWEGVTKEHLAKLVVKRRLEGGEFTYVYLPLDKAIQGKQAMFSFLKNQGSEYSAMMKACKNPSETEDAFATRLKQAILVVPYEKDVEMVDVSVPGKRKTDSPASGTKKARTDEEEKVVEPEHRMVFFEVEVFSHMGEPCEILQIGAVSAGGARFFAPLTPKVKASPEILAGLGFKPEPNTFQRGNRMKTPVHCVPKGKGFDKFLEFLKEVKGSAKTLTLLSFRRDTFAALLYATSKFVASFPKLAAIATSMSSLEEILQKRQMHNFLPVVPLVLNFINLSLNKRKVMNPHVVDAKAMKGKIAVVGLAGHNTSEDLAQRLADLVPKLKAKYNIPLASLCIESNLYIRQTKPPKPVHKEFFKPMGYYGGGHFTIINSITFAQKAFYSYGDLASEDSDASTSKLGSKAPSASRKESQGATTAKNKNEPEIVEVEEDDFNFKAVSSTTVFPVFCQPLLVALHTVDENTKFVKFSLNRTIQGQANAADWELLRDSAKVFWKKGKPFAFATVCPNLPNDSRNKSGKVDALALLPASTSLGVYKELNKRDEEQRNLSTKVAVDLVVTQGPGNPAKIDVGEEPVAVLVTAVLRQGSLIEGNIKQFEFRPTDVLLVTLTNVENIELSSNFVAVDRRQGVPNRAKVVVSSKGKQTLKSGQILASAILFQNDVNLLWQKLGERGTNKGKIMPAPALKMKGKRRPLTTVAASRLYAQGSNPLLVKLDYEVTKVSGKFSKVHLQFSEEFKKVISDNKKVLKIDPLSEDDAVVEVVWKKNIPYAMVNVNIKPNPNKPDLDFCDIVEGYGLGTWVPMDTETPKQKEKITMSLCVDFNEKKVMVDQHPILIKAYLKFKENEVEKVKVIQEAFAISKCYFPRLEILSVVIKPYVQGRLAPQKTSTNDMKVSLVVKSKDEMPVTLNAREVIADCVSADSDNVLNFKVSGHKVVVKMPPQLDTRDPPYLEEDMWGQRGQDMSYESMDMNDPFGQSSRGAFGARNPMFDMDPDYMEYSSHQEMAMQMDRKFSASFSRGGTRGGQRGGNSGRGRQPGGGGGVHSRLGHTSLDNRPGNKQQTSWNDGSRWVAGGKFNIDGLGAQRVAPPKGNPSASFDSFYEPEFQAGGKSERNSLFERARSKLNQRGGPPKKTWSN